MCSHDGADSGYKAGIVYKGHTVHIVGIYEPAVIVCTAGADQVNVCGILQGAIQLQAYFRAAGKNQYVVSFIHAVSCFAPAVSGASSDRSLLYSAYSTWAGR